MNRSNRALLRAWEIGYRVDSAGNVVSPYTGQLRKQQTRTDRRSGYRRVRFSVHHEGEKFPVEVHRLAAFQKFGEKLFESGIVVRHLDGDSTNNRPDNIAIGTPSDNEMDRSKEERVARARHAASFRAWPEDTIAEIKRDRERGFTYKQLTEKYGIAKSTLSCMLRR